ncbi:hypothetical protein FIBSPDRAFT_1050857 [Athelia psychrophila]|uniref:HNH nuclease domain-containing protein n=1 Tax=Athelia psychrophila TaxID=1759441 RepID=A0A166A3K9_9AGAM|nr:hypothetical protein FIBSPDRAFT_1050857 [Fibularhizoctonia sp. CBS 109695]
MESDHPSSPLPLSTPSPKSGPHYERDSTYEEKDKVQTTSAGTLKFGNSSVSSASSSRLESNSFKPNTCVLTGDTSATGSDIQKAHIVPHLTPRVKLKKYEWLLGYKVGEFHIDSHHNTMYIADGWYGKFDRGKWALVPDKQTRDAIVKKLKEFVQKRVVVVPVTSDGVALERKGGKSAWPHFEKVFYRKDKCYQYRFFNVALRSSLAAIWENDEHKFVDLSLQPLESHVHPLHVIINAYRKINDLKDASESSLEVIKDIREIWDIWHSIPVTPEFLQYGRTDSTQSSGMGPPPGPSEIRRSTRSSSGHDERSNDGDN